MATQKLGTAIAAVKIPLRLQQDIDKAFTPAPGTLIAPLHNDGVLTMRGAVLIKEEFMNAEAGLIKMKQYNHEVWRIRGLVSDAALDTIRAQIVGRVEQAFPYLFFSHYEDALWWRLREIDIME